MGGKFSFKLGSSDRLRALPGKIIIGQNSIETDTHVLLKLVAYIYFFRERVQLEPSLHLDSIPYVPDVFQMDYEMRPKLWVECGECSVEKLDRLAVKAPEAELWVVKRSAAEVQELRQAMAKEDLRRDRYGLVGLEPEMIDEMCGLLRGRNELFWVGAEPDPPVMQFDFNGLWFEMPFTVLRF